MPNFTARWRSRAEPIFLCVTLVVAGHVSAAGTSSVVDASAIDREVSAPAYARLSAPRYPKLAWLAAQEGQVTLRVQVDADGKASSVHVHSTRAPRDLVQAAIASVRRWRFTPARRDGAAVAASVLVPIEFAMGSTASAQRKPDADSGRRNAKS
jgi:TonB family protein